MAPPDETRECPRHGGSGFLRTVTPRALADAGRRTVCGEGAAGVETLGAEFRGVGGAETQEVGSTFDEPQWSFLFRAGEALGRYLEGGRSRLGGERTSPRSPPRAGPHPRPRPAGEFSLNV